MRATRLNASTKTRSGAETHRASKVSRVNGGASNGVAHETKTEADANTGLSGAPPLAPFIAIAASAVDAQMWPQHPVAWLQPELDPVIPASSGLRAERRNKVPAPDFAHVPIRPVGEPAGLQGVDRPLTPQLQPALPKTDLIPLGWDPRSCIPDANHSWHGVQEQANGSGGRKASD